MGIVDSKIDVMRKHRRDISRISNPSSKSDPSSSAAVQVIPFTEEVHDLFWKSTKAGPDELMSMIDNLEENVLLYQSPLKNTFLHIVAADGNLNAVIEIGRRYDFLVNKKNDSYDTPLHLAAEAGDAAVVSVLLSVAEELQRKYPHVGMVTKVKNMHDNTPLHKALISSNEAVARILALADPGAMFCLNNEEKSGLYLAAEAGYEGIITDTLKNYGEQNQIYELVKGKPPVHAAIFGRHIGVLSILGTKEPRLFQSTDEEGTTPLHIAALTGYFDGVAHLLVNYSLASIVRDKFGFFPVHWAAMQGHANVVESLLKHSPDPVELLDRKRRNVLHIAAENGRTNVVIYILKNLNSRKLINARDLEGNTPLHMATINWHPRIVSELTWNENLNSKLTNNEGLTALDAAEFYMDSPANFQQRLTWTALTASGAPRAPPRLPAMYSHQSSERSKLTATINNYKGRLNTLLVVATLIATVTFAAGFTVPGGYTSSDDPHHGQATMLRKKIFSVFIFCDTMAMYSAMIVTVSMIWAQLGDLKLVSVALRLGVPLLGVSLMMMSVAFMAGIYATVSDLHWLAHGVIIMGTIFFVALAAISFPLCFPVSSKSKILRYILHYPFLLLMYVTKSGTSSN